MGCCDLKSVYYRFPKPYEGYLLPAFHEASCCWSVPEICWHYLGREKLWPPGKSQLIYGGLLGFVISSLVLRMLEVFVPLRVIVLSCPRCCESRCVCLCVMLAPELSQTTAIFLAVGSAPNHTPLKRDQTLLSFTTKEAAILACG